MAQEDSVARIVEPAPAGKYDKVFGLYNAETVQDKGWKMLLYGASGSGKTYFAGTFPDPIVLDLEDGMRTLVPMSKSKTIRRYPANLNETITEWSQVKKFYQAVKVIPAGQAPFKTIVIDSLNELQILVMKNILGTIDASRIYEDQPTQGDYGKLARDMQAIVRDFFQLPYNVVMTAAASDSEYDDEKIFPLFTGKKTGPDVRRIAEQIGYCFTYQKSKEEPVQYLVGFSDNPRYLAKTRAQGLEKPIANNYQAMINRVERLKQGADK